MPMARIVFGYLTICLATLSSPNGFSLPLTTGFFEDFARHIIMLGSTRYIVIMLASIPVPHIKAKLRETPEVSKHQQVNATAVVAAPVKIPFPTPTNAASRP